MKKEMTKNNEYRTVFEKAVSLLKAAQERALSEAENQQLNEHIDFCRQHERES